MSIGGSESTHRHDKNTFGTGVRQRRFTLTAIVILQSDVIWTPVTPGAHPALDKNATSIEPLSDV